MNISYYPGCSAAGSASDYEKSTQVVCQALGLKFSELPDWSCCGSTPAHAVDTELSAALCVRNLDIAARRQSDKVVTTCPSCLSNLRLARKRMETPAFRARVNELLDEPCRQELPQTYSIMQVIHETYGPELVASRTKKPLTGLRVAPYYGCLLSRPADVMADFGNPENPQIMEDLLKACGAEVLDFPLKTDCCGAAFGIPERKVTATLSGKILDAATRMGADVIAVACPLCQMNLDLRQRQAAKEHGKDFNIPVVYFTQLMGLAFGFTPAALGMEKLIVSAAPLLKKLEAGA